jgi:uncharacterized membrane protein
MTNIISVQFLLDTLFYAKKNAIYGIVILLAFTVRLYKIDSFGTWFDEKESVSCALGIKSFKDENNFIFNNELFAKENNLRNIISSTMLDNGNALFYYLTLNKWISIFSASDLSIRMLSLIAGLTLVILLMLLSNDLFNSKLVNITVGLFAAVNPVLLNSSQLARGYCFAALYCIIACYCFVKIIKSSKHNSFWTIVYTLSIIFSLFSHYLTIYVFLIHILIAVYFIFKKKYQFVIHLISPNIFSFFLLYAWLYHFGIEGKKAADVMNLQYAQNAKNWKPGDDMWCAPMSHQMVFTGSAQVLLPMFGNYFQNWGFRIRQVVLFLLIPFALIFIAIKFALFEHRNYIYILLIIVLGYLFFATYLAYRAGHIIPYQTWYSGFVVPYALLLISYPAIYFTDKKSAINKRIKKIVFSLITIQLIISAVSCIPYYMDIGKSRESNPYEKLAKTLILDYEYNDTVIFSNWRDATITNFYLIDENYIIQKVDSSSHYDKIFLKRGNNEFIEIADLKNKRY